MGYIKKAVGKYKGSPQDRRRNKRIEDELRKGTSWSDIAERVGCGRATVARVATRLRRELAA
jgi:DNA invertase Pin-like site-specific DNA recombinase